MPDPGGKDKKINRRTRFSSLKSGMRRFFR